MADYYGMTSIDTAVVSDTGDLLIGLTDGNVINAGYVRGRPGPQGERGLMGPTGDPGRNGLDGAQLYTGVGAPADDMGKEGDLYIDLASRFLDIFQKTGGGWIVISTLRDASDSKGSGFLPGMSGTHDGDGTGGGSNVIINNDAGGPTQDANGTPVLPGMLWYNPDTGHLFVRSENNLEWIPIAGLPSAEFSADPPTEDRGGHPIEEGDLWWDTDLAALFVAARDVTDQIVWVVALPADRGAVPDTQLPFQFPFSTDGRIETNPTTGIRYIYHAAKNQWIDIPTTGNNIFYQEDPPSFENVNLGIGDIWVKESDKQVYVFDGISWKEVRARPKVYSTDVTPDPAIVSEGELYFDTSEDDGTLYIFYGGGWVPAAPPVSTEGIESNLRLLNEAVQGLQATASSHTLQIADAQSTQYGLVQLAAQTSIDVGELQASQTVQDNQIIELEEEIESLAPSLDRGKWNLAELGAGVTLAAGQYAMGIGVDSVYCQEKYLECVANANNDPFLMSECTRLVGECETAKDNGQEYYINDWSHATFLHFHKTDFEGKNHTFIDYKVGMFIDLFDQGDTGYAVFEITAEPTLDGDIYTIGVHPVQHEGEAAGLARVKVFELSGAEVTDFVRKTGDTMTGNLNLVTDTYDANWNTHPRIIFKNPNSDGEEVKVELYQTTSYLRSSRSFEARGSLSAYGNIQYNGSTRLGMSSGGTNYLGVGTSSSKRAFIWNEQGLATKIQASNGYGAQGQALTVGPNETLQWAAPVIKRPSGLRFKYQSYQGDPSQAVDGKMYKSSNSSTSGTLYVSRFDLDGIVDLNVLYAEEHESTAVDIPDLEYEESDDPVALSSSKTWDLGSGLPLSFYQQNPQGLWKLVKTMNITKVMMLTSITPLYLTYNAETRYGSTAYTYSIITLPGFF